jgi:anti-sigma factor RsiW
MHARIDQLLSVLDREPVDATVHSHLEQCAGCGEQLAAHTHTTEQLRALSQLEPPKQAWEQIAGRLQLRTSRSRWRSRPGVAALAAGVLALTIAFSEWGNPQADISQSQLMERSRELDWVYLDLPQRPSVERPGLAVTLDAIEQRVQWLDWRLSAAPESELNERQVRTLWNERVTLMDSLIKLRYAESERASF